MDYRPLGRTVKVSRLCLGTLTFGQQNSEAESHAQMAIAFAASRPFVTSTIIGATTMDQLKTDIAAADLTLSDAVLADIEQVHLDYPNPCP